MCFSGCLSVINIEIPSSISLIDNGAFETDSLLTCQMLVFEINKNSFICEFI